MEFIKNIFHRYLEFLFHKDNLETVLMVSLFVTIIVILIALFFA